MKWRGAKQSEAYRTHEAAREAFLGEMFECAIHGPECRRWDISAHEMTPGKNRMRAFGVRAAWLPACGVCNCGVLRDNVIWPLAKQLALKLLIDPVYFDLILIRKILAPEGTPVDRLPIVVTEAEVLEYVRELLSVRAAA